MPASVCPACGAPVLLSNQTKMGQRVICGSCSETLEVTWLKPVELDFPFDDDGSEEFDDDWLDDDD